MSQTLRFPGGIFPRLVALFPLLFPLYLFRGVLFGIPVTFPELILGFLFLYFLFDHEPFRWSEWKKVWPVAMFFLAGILGLAVVPHQAFMVDGTEFPSTVKALGIFKGWIVAPMLYFVMARSVLREKPSLILWALNSLLFSGTVLSLLGLQQVYTGEFLTPDGRASGPFESANYLALYLGPLVVYGVFAFLETKSRRAQALLGAATILCILGLYFTASYAAFIAVFAALFLGFLIFLRRRSPQLFYGTLAAGILTGILLLFSQLGSEKFTQFLDFSERSSSSVRIQVYSIALELIKTHPFLGIGLGQYEQQYQAVAVATLGQEPFEWNMLHPHNLFLATWLSMGLLGLVALFILLYQALQWLFEKDSHQRALAALMLVTLLVHGLFDTPYFKNDLAFQFWLLMAILL
jgi:O-antigen ligase